MKRYLAFLFLSPGLSLLAQQTSVAGHIRDVSGATVRGAHIVANPVHGGSRYEAISGDSGAYQIPSLSAADYKFQVDSASFGSQEKTVTVLIGQSLVLDFALSAAAQNTSVTVSSTDAKIDTTTSEVGSTVDPQQMARVPLNGRNWLQLASLVPGIRSNDITPYTVLSRNSTGTFQLNVDGEPVTQDNELSWKGQPQFSRDAISQFQVITNRFDATQGRSSQIQINAQTKSGTDSIHGTVFGYFRNDVFNASDPIARKVLPYSDQQYGGTIGGPIHTGKLYYFASYEGERNPFTFVTQPVGFAAWSKPATLLNNVYLAHFDYNLSEKDHLSLRGYGFTSSNPAYFAGATNPNPSVLESFNQNAYSGLLSYNHVFGPHAVNEAKLSINNFYYGQQVAVRAPQLNFPTATIGTDVFAPTLQNQDSRYFRDDYYLLLGRHSIKLGFEYQHQLEHGIYSRNFFGTATINRDPQNFATPTTFQALFPDLFNPSTWNLSAINPYVTLYTQTFGDNHFGVPQGKWAFWFQDDWKLFSRLTLNLGLRYDNTRGVFNVPVNFSTASGLTKPNHGDNNNIQPRLGFAWDPTGKGKTSIRGGSGIYYGNVTSVNTKASKLQNGVVWVTATASNPVNLNNPFNGATAAQILANSASYVQAVTVLDPNIEMPWSSQTSVGVQRELPVGFIFSADYLHNRTRHLGVTPDINLVRDPNTGYALNPNTNARPNTRYSTISQAQSPANIQSIYDALLINLQKRRWRGFDGSVAYTFAREKDNTAFNNPFAIGANWANAVDDQRHTINVNGNFQWRYGLRAGTLYHFGSGTAYAVSAGSSPTNVTGTTNQFYCGLTSTNAACTTKRVVYNNPELNHYDEATGFNSTDRNQFVGRAIHRVDANLAKDISVGGERRITLQVEAFNLLNHSNYGAYNTNILVNTFGTPATQGDLAYYARMLQFSGRFSF